MPSEPARSLVGLKNPGQLAELGHEVFDENCSEGQSFDALGKLFFKLAASEYRPALGQREILELKAADVIIEALRQKRDVTTLFRLAGAARIPGPTHLSDRCLDAALATGVPQLLHQLAIDEGLNSEGTEQVRSAMVSAAASAIVRLAKSGFADAYQLAASLFSNGEGVPSDLSAAKEWYTKAAIYATMEAAGSLETLAWAHQSLLECQEHSTPEYKQFRQHIIPVAIDSARRIRVLMPGDEIPSLIDGGEHDYVEFKATLRWCTKSDCLKPELEKEVVKAAAGLLNSKGGCLFIGVTDAGQAYGIEKDWESLDQSFGRNRDGFARHLRQVLEKTGALGRRIVLRLIAIEFHPLHGHEICLLRIAPSDKPVFIRMVEKPGLFVRSGPSTICVAESDLPDFIEDRWPEFGGRGS